MDTLEKLPPIREGGGDFNDEQHSINITMIFMRR